MSNILVVAPHPDDETLGMGATIKKYLAIGHNVFWLIVTGMKDEYGYSISQVKKRAVEIEKVNQYYGFSGCYQLSFPPAGLNDIMIGQCINRVGEIVKNIQPDEIYLPFPGDIHSDHRYVFDIMKATSKWFRYPSVKRILCYETLSETNFSFPIRQGGHFIANVYEDVTDFLSTKISAMEIYVGEYKEHPFPRSSKAIESLAALRGSECGCEYAEAFMLLKEIRNV